MSINLPARRLLIIFNPVAGWRRRRRLNAVVQRLEATGCEVEVRETMAAGDAERLAAEADALQFDRLVVAGGDGTINEAVNGLAGSMLPLAIVPLGTANVLAAEIGLATDADSIARTILVGLPRPVSLGRANERRFLMMVGAGFDAHVVRDVRPVIKAWLGRAAYVLASLRQLFVFRFRGYRVVVDGQPFEAGSVVVSNGRYYAGKFVCAPAGDIERPELEVCLFQRNDRIGVVLYAVALFTGSLGRLRSYRVVPGTAVEIIGEPGEPLQGDGDVVGTLGAEIASLPSALNLVFPPARETHASDADRSG